MYTLAIENHLGEKIRLSGNPDYSITNVTGISPPYANISLSENATMDGGTFNVSKLTSRNIVSLKLCCISEMHHSGHE